ncbi:MAG: hypothetical protein IPG50_36585 [Myxococcales bacterium]|nr:hypothetical protein [Myxococcales bacterium]
MPVTLAPGISGQVPSLSIQYSSHGANGILGQGFSLSGLSVIAPCPRGGGGRRGRRRHL